jgi:cytochrome c556
MPRSVLLLAATALIAATAASMAHEGASGVVRERMEAMEQLAQALNAIEERAGGIRELDKVAADAAELRRLTARMAGMFPAGSGQHPSEANKKVWSQRSQFDAIMRRLEQALETMSVAAQQAERERVAGELRKAKQTCLDCHEVFRTKHPGH